MLTWGFIAGASAVRSVRPEQSRLALHPSISQERFRTKRCTKSVKRGLDGGHVQNNRSQCTVRSSLRGRPASSLPSLAVWIAALFIVIIILTVAAVLPGVLKANHQSHETRISDVELVSQR
jgi:hypothetical protein